MTFFSTSLTFGLEKHSVLKVDKWPFWSTIGIPGTELSMGPKSIPNWSPPIGGPNMGWGVGYPKMRDFGLTESHSLCLLKRWKCCQFPVYLNSFLSPSGSLATLGSLPKMLISYFSISFKNPAESWVIFSAIMTLFWVTLASIFLHFIRWKNRTIEYSFSNEFLNCGGEFTS